MKVNKTGHCHICNNYGKLTFEHIPPRSALNDKKARIFRGDSYIKLISEEGRYPWEHDGIKFKEQQRGIGDYTLCSKCNNITGELYGEEYKKWFFSTLKFINDDLEGLKKSKNATLTLKSVYPARFIRQVLSIICSTSKDFTKKYPFVKELILNKDYKYIEKPDFKIYMYLLKNPYNGYTGITGLLYKSGMKIVNEIDLYPFGFIVSLSEEPEIELEITQFMNLGYDDIAEVELTMNTHEKNNILALDFRTKEEIMKIEKNQI